MAYVIYANGTRLDDAGIILNTPVDGGPGWIHSDRYTIAAKADGEASEGTMRGPMFRALLEERFKLRIRRERRDVDAYALTIARGGPRLQPFQEGSCVALPVPLRLPLPELPPGQRHCKMPGLVGDDPAAKFLAMVIEANAHIEWEGITLDAFVRSALNEMNTGLGRQVIDRTGLNGRFNIRLDYAQPPVDPVRFPALAAARAAAGEPTAPSIETALQEQLGLKLESAKGEGHRFVIESIGRPSEN
jgi:uncharacterized protein (TIGR03435 family)